MWVFVCLKYMLNWFSSKIIALLVEGRISCYVFKIIGYFIWLNFSQHCKLTCIYNVYEFLLFDDIWPINQMSLASTLLKGRPRLVRALWLKFFEIVRNIRRKLYSIICAIGHDNATLGDNVTRQLTQLRGYNSINRWQGEERSNQSIP